MSTLPPPWDPSDDADEQYRRASEADPSCPSEATRRAVLAHAARLAVERGRREARQRRLSLLGAALRWRPAIVGTVAAAVLAGVVIAPQFLAPRVPESARAPATILAPVAPAQEIVLAPVPARAPAPADSASRSAPRAMLQRPRVSSSADQASLRESAPSAARVNSPAVAGAVQEQEVVVTARARTAAPIAATPIATAPAAPQAQRPPPADAAALRHAAAAGELAAISAQLTSGGDIDARDAQGRTALMLATLNGQTNAVSLLLAHGADPNAADAHGTTPLQAAIAAGEGEISSALRRYGAR